MGKKASIIIPIYNAEKYLNRCLDSVISQEYDNFEIICIDDCSTDESHNILNKYATLYKDKITVIYNSKNIGQGKSRSGG